MSGKGKMQKEKCKMKKIFLETNDEEAIHFSLISEQNPIFAKKDGVLAGMVVNEEGKGWILRTGGTFGATGHCDNLRECLQKGQKFGYAFYTRVEREIK